MSTLLLLMPEFMGYEKVIIHELEKKYYVDYLNCDCFDKDIIGDYYNCNKLRWGVRHLIKSFDLKDRTNAQLNYVDNYLQLIDASKTYDYVFCINGGYMHENVYKNIKERNPNAKFILYAWDDINNLFARDHICHFDCIFSYNIDDCKKYNWKYVPMFANNNDVGHAPFNKYDIVFIGSDHPERIAIADQLLEKYGKKYKIYIYMYSIARCDRSYFHDVSLSYNDYINLLKETKAILDVPAASQTGPTTRFFDSLTTKTKVITTNKHIIKYPVYNENISIINANNIVLDDVVFSTPYSEPSYKALSVKEWLSVFSL